MKTLNTLNADLMAHPEELADGEPGPGPLGGFEGVGEVPELADELGEVEPDGDGGGGAVGCHGGSPVWSWRGSRRWGACAVCGYVGT